MARQPHTAGTRIERDLLGERSVPEGALFGVQTVRAQENFAVGGERLCDRPALLVALAQVKVAAALANRDLGVLSPKIADAIVAAARELASGLFFDQFPLEIVQGGGGTSTHMNVNEVLANRANERLGASRGQYAPVHPNDHVNRSQSTNDVVPTAAGLAVYVTAATTRTRLGHLGEKLLELAATHNGLEHLGRTCLQDAVPVPVPAFHRAQAHAVEHAIQDLEAAAARMLVVPLGGTAVGSGLGAPKGFQKLAVRYLREESGLDVRCAEDLFAALASLEPFARVADAMARAGRVVARVAADLRLLASGPVGGIGEVRLPPLQPGSSMMPGKINPVLPELVMQVSYELAGAAHTVGLASAAGELDVAVMGPVVTAELLGGLERLGRVADLFTERCLAGLQWLPDRVVSNLGGSLKEAVESIERLGYERASSMGTGRPERLRS